MGERAVTRAIFALSAIAAVLAPAAAQADDALKLKVDQAQVVRLAAQADTVIIGNPMIADATVRDARTLIVTGHTFGTTNIIVLDGSGNPILDSLVTVESGTNDMVTMYRLSKRESFSCTPTCEPTLTVGDQTDTFSGRRDQISERNGLSKGE